MKRSLVLFSLFFVTTVMYGQYGWTNAKVYLKNGETKEGEAYLPVQKVNAVTVASNERLVYRLAKKEKKERFKPEEVDSVLFFVDGRKDTYVPVYLNDKKKLQGFMQLMIDGELQLVGRTEEYASDGKAGEEDPNPWELDIPDPELKNYFNHNRLMLIKNGEILDRLKIKGFRVRAMEFFEGCDGLVQKLDSKEFTKDDFLEIVEFYNANCKIN